MKNQWNMQPSTEVEMAQVVLLKSGGKIHQTMPMTAEEAQAKPKLIVMDNEPMITNRVKQIAYLLEFDAQVASNGRRSRETMEYLAGLDLRGQLGNVY